MDLSKSLETVEADEGFIRYLWEEHFPTWVEDVIIPLADKKLLDSGARKQKRRLQQANPDGWRKEWKEHYLPSLKEGRKQELHMRRSLFGVSEIASIPSKDPKGPGRPRDNALWSFVWLARAYFKRLTGGPRWRLIAQILEEWGGYTYQAFSLESAWVGHNIRADFMIPSRKQIADLKSSVLKLERYMRSPAGKDEKESLEIGRQKILAQIAFLQERHEENLRWLKNNPTSMEREGLAVEWDPDAWLDSYLRCYKTLRAERHARDVVLGGVKFTLEYWEDEGWYVGGLREDPSVCGRGGTLSELEENIREAMERALIAAGYSLAFATPQ